MEQLQPRWTVGAVARRLGVAPATLRTWDRRYGLGPSDHSLGAHRRYDGRDVQRLERMTNLLHQGVSAADAARIAVESTDIEPTTPASPRRRSEEDLSDSQRRRRGLLRAAMALDSASVIRRLESGIAELGVVVAWDDLIRPVLAEAGRRWATGGDCVPVEHLLSDCLVAVMHGVVNAAPPPLSATRPVLLACAAEERHDLPLHVLRAALCSRRVKVMLLGAATPSEALGAASRQLGPAAVAVWSQDPRTADVAMFDAVPQLRPAIATFAAGPGWDRVTVPEGTRRMFSLTEAVDSLVAVTGASALDIKPSRLPVEVWK